MREILNAECNGKKLYGSKELNTNPKNLHELLEILKESRKKEIELIESFQETVLYYYNIENKVHVFREGISK